MKKAALVLLFFYFNSAVCQNFTAQLQEVQTEDRLFSGSIDQKYDFTMYLHYNSMSMDNLGIYSVKGWYYYENVKKKIPLVGIYNGNDGGNLVLYSFRSKEKQDKILEFDYMGSTWKVLDSINALTDFDEKFDTSNKEWSDGKKKLKFDFYSRDYDVLDNYQLLTIVDKTAKSQDEATKNINLNAIIRYHYGFELVSYLKKPSELKVLLRYEHLSRANIQGMCGAGYEIGYIILTFDSQFHLLDNQTLEIESCLDTLSNTELKSDSENIIKLKITDGNDMSKTVTIDKKSIEIKTL